MESSSETRVDMTTQYELTVAQLGDLVEHRKKDALETYGGVEGVAQKIKADTKNGLSEAEADSGFTDRRAVFGVNRYPEPPTTSWFSFWFESIKDLTMIILIVAAVVSIVIGAAVPADLGQAKDCLSESTEEDAAESASGWIEGVAILIAVGLVSTVTATNNYTKELKFRALAAKEKDVPVQVMREGTISTISVFEINVGDVVMLDMGNQVPADGLLIQSYDLRLDESQMTGEPVPVKKNHDDPFMLSGCKVTDGSGKYFVTSVGPNSMWGKTIASLGDKPRPTPLQENLDDMAGLIGKGGMAIAVLVFIVLFLWWIIPAATQDKDWVCRPSESEDYDVCLKYSDADTNPLCELRGYDWSNAVVIVAYFITAVTIVVVAVPEGLPLAVTISLAYSMKQMYKDQNLVRHLKACETMSNCTNICSDKTGTLTENQMTVVKGWVAGEKFEALPLKFTLKDSVSRLVSESIALNTAQTSAFHREEGKPLQTVGNKTECALLIFLDAIGINFQTLRDNLSESIFQRWTFSSAKKRMQTITWLDKSVGVLRLHCKGAPEIVLHRSLYYLESDGRIVPLDDAARDSFQQLLASWASQGLRTLCLAYRDIRAPTSTDPIIPTTLGVEGIPVIHPSAGTAPSASDIAPDNSGPIPIITDPSDNVLKFADAPDNDMIIFAMVGIQDPVRPEVPGAVRDCQAAGITVRMVTGDNITTAKSIAKECGILSDEGVALEGPAFAALSDEQLDQILQHIQVIARCSPSDKQRLVKRLIEKGEVVAVTGDGTNDVPALKEADIGLAMGIRGTDIAKQASDIVILDDNFQSIVRSVMWGRNVYDNIRKFLQFQLTVNLSALAVVFIGAVSQRGTPLKAIQLLWVNLIMDTFAALALGTEAPTRALLDRKPFGRYDRLISNFMIRSIVVQSTFQITILLVLLYAGKYFPWLDAPCAYASKNNLHELTDCFIDGKRATNAEIEDHTAIIQTCIFNTFVYCQLFNEINARKVNGERNVWEKFWTNWMFMAIMLFTGIGQAVLVIFPGKWMSVVPFPGIGWKQWLTCMIIAIFTLPLGLIASFIPVPKAKPRKFKGSEDGSRCFGLIKPKAAEEEKLKGEPIDTPKEGTSAD